MLQTEADIEANFTASQMDKLARLFSLAGLALYVVIIDYSVLQVEHTFPKLLVALLIPKSKELAELALGHLVHNLNNFALLFGQKEPIIFKF